MTTRPSANAAKKADEKEGKPRTKRTAAGKGGDALGSTKQAKSSRTTSKARSRVPQSAASEPAVPHEPARDERPLAVKAERTTAENDENLAPPRKSSVPARLSTVERHRLIEVAAYYIAERRGFHGEAAHEDWLRAEAEIDAMIAQGRFDQIEPA